MQFVLSAFDPVVDLFYTGAYSYPIPARCHSREGVPPQAGGIQQPYQRDAQMVSLDARQKHAARGMTNY
jgi:hypothetical protein